MLVALGLVRLVFAEALGPRNPFLMQFVAVLVAAWFGGVGAGAIITALAAYLGRSGLLPGTGANAGGVAVLAFVVEGFAISWLAGRLSKERWRALDAARSAREASDKLEVVLHGIADGITMQDHEGRLVYANQAAARIVGFPSAAALLEAPGAEILKRFELFDPDGAPFPLERLPSRALLAGRVPEETLVQYETRGSDARHWSIVNANGVLGSDGRLRFVVNVFRDVTERRRQEEALRVSHERFSTVLKSIGDAVIATDANGTVTFLNPVAESLTGWTSEQAAGRPLVEVFSLLDAETRERAESPVLRALGEGAASRQAGHALLLRRDGGELAINDSVAPIRGRDGELAGVVLVFRDVTAERRAAERREFLSLATLELNSSLDYAATLATVARLAVPRMADWCAVDVVEDGQVRRLAVAHVDPSKVRWVEEIQARYPPKRDAERGVPNILRTGKAEMLAEIPGRFLETAARDAEHLEVIRKLSLHSYIGVPMTRGRETFGAITLVMAESKRAYVPEDLELATALADRAAIAVENARLFRAAEQARTEAVQASRAKDDFLAMLGHELRNPLAPIVTALELIRHKPAAGFERERAVIERQVRHVVRLVDDLLDVSRIVRGRVTLARKPVDMGEVVDKALELAQPLIEERRHHVAVSVPPGLVIVGDAIRLTQVLTNLLSNAAKYTEPEGHIALMVERAEGASGHEVTISVKDDGMGIAPEVLPRIFELFVQAPQTIDRSSGGLGLGLTIVQNLVRLAGGTVTAMSDGHGRGSEFLVRLPSPSLPAMPLPPSKSSRPSAPSTSINILVVDDNVDALEMLVEALNMLGYDAHPAADVQSALRIAEEKRPNVALLDIGLPDMDGYELGKRLRQLPGLEGLKLVALTGYGQASDKARSSSFGFAAHLVKPIDLDALSALLGDLSP